MKSLPQPLFCFQPLLLASSDGQLQEFLTEKSMWPCCTLEKSEKRLFSFSSLLLRHQLCSGWKMLCKDILERVRFLKSEPTRSQDHLQGKTSPNRTSIRCLCQTHDASIDLGVLVEGRIIGIMLNTNPCSVADEQPHNAVYCNAQEGSHSRPRSDRTCCTVSFHFSKNSVIFKLTSYLLCTAHVLYWGVETALKFSDSKI